MRNISEEWSKENLYTYFMLNNPFHKPVPFMGQGENYIVQSDRLQIGIINRAWALNAG